MLRRTKNRRKMLSSLSDSINGLNNVFINEDNFKREIILAIISLIMAYILKVSTIEFIIIILVITLVLILEMINTAIETVVDLCTKEYHPLAKRAKDISAGAVLIVCIASLIIGIIIFVPKIINLLGGK